MRPQVCPHAAHAVDRRTIGQCGDDDPPAKARTSTGPREKDPAISLVDDLLDQRAERSGRSAAPRTAAGSRLSTRHSLTETRSEAGPPCFSRGKESMLSAAPASAGDRPRGSMLSPQRAIPRWREFHETRALASRGGVSAERAGGRCDRAAGRLPRQVGPWCAPGRADRHGECERTRPAATSGGRHTRGQRGAGVKLEPVRIAPLAGRRFPLSH
jgi:hypothetical protein